MQLSKRFMAITDKLVKFWGSSPTITGIPQWLKWPGQAEGSGDGGVDGGGEFGTFYA